MCLFKGMEPLQFLFCWRYENGSVITPLTTVMWDPSIVHKILPSLSISHHSYLSSLGHSSVRSHAPLVPPKFPVLAALP